MKTTKMLTILVLTLGLVASVANADFTFGTPTNLGPIVNSSSPDEQPSISPDGLSLYFCSDRPGGVGAYDLWVTTRATKDDEWGPPVNLGTPINSPEGEYGPNISADGLSLYFSSGRPGGSGSDDIWMTSRANPDSEWGPPVNLGPSVNSSAGDGMPSISVDGLELYFMSKRPGGYGRRDLWVTTRDTVGDPWGEPVNLGPLVNSSEIEQTPSISADGLSLYFGSKRPGVYGGHDLWVTTRATISEPWGVPVNLGPTVNSSAHEASVSISADGSTLYFISQRAGGLGDWDLWQVPIIPIVDLNGDGIVDSADMCIMVDHWGTDEPSCDIGPTPFGDSIVDVQDLIVLAEHLFTYPGAVAYWKLDETEGDIAYDSVAVNDAVVFGDAVWQPTGGAVDGALEFDGIDDYVSTSFILDPADAVFSVFAWIKGGAPGQVILSQIGGVNWLSADPSEGKLRTSLLCPAGGRFPPEPLASEFVITDGVWHRIVFVWDGSQRLLYVDDVEVARDMQDSLEGSAGGLYIGAGKTLEPGSFFSGLIDDIRIYNRAITP